MNRFTAKLVHGFTRLAFWRKRAASAGDVLEPPDTPEPATARHSLRSEAESSTAEDVPVPQAGWFARLKQTLIRRPSLAQELPADAEQAVAMERPSREQDEASATADDVPVPNPSWLARLKSPFRRHPKPEPLEADEDTPRTSLGQSKTATASSQADSTEDEDAVRVSGIQRLRAVLASKWVWVPGISVMLIAVFATMLGMLLQSGQEKKQLQTELVAAQKKLKLASAAKPVAFSHGASKPAGNPAVAAVEAPSAGSAPGAYVGGCDVSNTENVTHNLKNCIDSFNALAN